MSFSFSWHSLLAYYVCGDDTPHSSNRFLLWIYIKTLNTFPLPSSNFSWISLTMKMASTVLNLLLTNPYCISSIITTDLSLPSIILFNAFSIDVLSVFYPGIVATLQNFSFFLKVAPYCFLKCRGKSQISTSKTTNWVFWKRMKLKLCK